MSISQWIGPIAQLASLIRQWIAEGESTAQIQRRLADPNGIAAELLTRADARRKRGRDLIG